MRDDLGTGLLTRRAALALGASCAGVVALRTLAAPIGALAAEDGVAPPVPPPGAASSGAAAATGAGATSAPIAATPSEQMLLLGRREVSPAGQRMQALVANEVFPSFELRAREGELLRVTVENGLDVPSALHWHGLVVPNAMDGVAPLTQPPIEPKASFVYELPLREAGTYFYESSWQLQRQVGLAGPLVIEERSGAPAVDHDEVLLLSDWTNTKPQEVVPLIRSGRADVAAEQDPQRLVNQAPDGTPFPVDVRYNAFLLNGRSHRDAWRKEVKPGERLRLRLINASASTFFRFLVEGHALQVIAADGRPVAPVEVDDLVLATGERYDVLLTVGAAGSYTMRAAALGASGGAVGVLHTPGVRPVVSTRPPQWGKRGLTYAALRATADTTLGGGTAVQKKISIEGDPKTYAWSVDGRVYPGELTPPGTDAGPPLALPAGTRVELELANRTTFWQPLHLHGYRFRLLADPKAGARAPWKDTAAVAPGASVKIELRADNPGRWLLPSANLYRAQAGLARLIEVG